MAREGRPEEQSDVAQLRAELAILRAQVQLQQDREALSEAEKVKQAEFLAWVSKSAQERTQLAANKKFAGEQGQTWEVELPEHPRVRLPAYSEFDAIGRYNGICGIIGTEKQYSAQLMGAAGVQA